MAKPRMMVLGLLLLSGLMLAGLTVYGLSGPGVSNKSPDYTSPERRESGRHTLMGNRFLTFSTLVRVRQIEMSRDEADGPDESSVHTPEEARTFREAVEKGWPGARITWGFSWLALKDQRSDYQGLKKLVVSYHQKYGDEITFVPGGYFANMYNSREQVNRDLHDGLQMVSEMVGGGYRPRAVIAGFLAADNLRYLAEQENIHVCQGNIWSQYAVDNGDGEGSLCYPYYPSREHFCKPAQSQADLIDCVNLDGWTVDFLSGRIPGGQTVNGERWRSRQGVGPIETLLDMGTERGLQAMLAATAAHFDAGFEHNGFAWVTSIWELCLVEGRKIYGYKGRNGIDGLVAWLTEIRRRWPDAQCITHGEFGERWRKQVKNNDHLDYRFVQRGCGIRASEADKEIRWFMNKDFRLAILRDGQKDEPGKVIDFTRYDLPAAEPPDPEPGKPSRNWSLMNRLNQKGVRPQDQPIPLQQLTSEEQALIKRRYPELINDKGAQPKPFVADLKPEVMTFEPFTWPNEIPEGCPFERSKTFKDIRFLGVKSGFRYGDTWYPTWAENDILYSGWTDGKTKRLDGYTDWSQSWVHPEHITTGQGVILGDDPLTLIAYSIGLDKSSPAKPYPGRYPCGSLVHNGVWYYGTYCLGPGDGVNYGKTRLNWPWIGPFVGFRTSEDYGHNWTPPPHTPEKPIFGESGLWGYPVKIGAPHFVDFGKNMEHSPDGKAYLVAHGADQHTTTNNWRMWNDSWITGDQVYLLRVTPGIQTINDPKAYEFYGGKDKDGKPVWTSEFDNIKPLLEWDNNMGCVTVTYNPALKKYIMCVTDGGNTVSRMNTYLLEADRLDGDWKVITYMKEFGTQAYFVNIPSKFISPDGVTMWLLYSGNFSLDQEGKRHPVNPPGGHYGMTFQKIELLRK